MLYPLLGMPQGAEWIVILAIVILVFGAAKLPDLARSTGQALKIFKSETKGLMDEDDKKSSSSTASGGTPTSVAPQQLPPASTSGSGEPTGSAAVEPSTDRNPG